MALDVTSQQIFNDLSSYLADLGLGNLFSVDGEGNPSGWLWDQVTQGFDTRDTLIVRLEETPQFKTRYKVINDLRQRAAQGEPVQVPTVAEVRQYEQTASQMMRQAGMPTWFYDSYTDTQSLMAQGVSPSELEARIARGWDVVRNADPAVREAFSSFYGVGAGENALAAFVLDPQKTLNSIERASRAAYTAGYGKQQNLQIDQTYAETIANLQQSEQQISQGLSEAGKIKQLTVAGITEEPGLTDKTAIESSIFGNAEATTQLERRALERSATGRASTGGAALTQAGLTGVKSV